MNPDLLSSTVSLALLAVVAALLLAHLSQLTGAHRLRHAVDALTCAGLLYLFGSRALGWNALPREALSVLFAVLAVGVMAYGAMRDARGEDAGFPWRLTALQAAAMAYLFGPFAFWRPAASLLLLFFFVLETMRWLAGTEEEEEKKQEQSRSPHPPLFPPRRQRGVREFALAGTAAVLAYVFFAGMGRAPLAPPPESPAPAAEATAEPPAPTEATAETAGESAKPAAEPAAPESSPPAADYTTVAGDTFKSIAKKLYGQPEKWRALAAVNPRVKPGAKFKAGVKITLPEPPTR